ncbi:UDP-galactopyranose mutase, partial [Streptococcus suis]|nr:UDP-galactopyranose mutase [Streptococcus suis]
TIITREYSKTWTRGDEPYYPVNNDRNNKLYTALLINALQNNKRMLYLVDVLVIIVTTICTKLSELPCSV